VLLGDPEPVSVMLWLGLCFALAGAVLGGLVAVIGWTCRRRLVLDPANQEPHIHSTTSWAA